MRDRLAGAVFASVEVEAEGSPIGGGLPPQIQPARSRNFLFYDRFVIWNKGACHFQKLLNGHWYRHSIRSLCPDLIATLELMFLL